MRKQRELNKMRERNLLDNLPQELKELVYSYDDNCINKKEFSENVLPKIWLDYTKRWKRDFIMQSGSYYDFSQTYDGPLFQEQNIHSNSSKVGRFTLDLVIERLVAINEKCYKEDIMLEIFNEYDWFYSVRVKLGSKTNILCRVYSYEQYSNKNSFEVERFRNDTYILTEDH
jgi:hypothetical protein